MDIDRNRTYGMFFRSAKAVEEKMGCVNTSFFVYKQSFNISLTNACYNKVKWGELEEKIYVSHFSSRR